MIERKYSVSEIDRMRVAIQRSMPIERSTLDDVVSVERKTRAMESRAEEQLRTYMIAGADPDEVVREMEKSPCWSL